jgi:hypothetical protein
MEVFIPEGAGRVKGGFGLGFVVVLAFAGHDGMASRLLSLIAAISCEPAVRVRDRAFGPAALAVPQASLTRWPASR